jgi:SET domain-containing protein
MYHQPNSYLSPKLEGRTRSWGDKGVFAREAIEAGELLVVWGGEVRTWKELEQLPPRTRQLSLQVEENLYLVYFREGPADWVNHSCDPNAGLKGHITLVAMRNITAGEEICFDYAMTDGSPYDQFECGCGAANCRTRVTGEDWRLPELWGRYAGYFSPYLQRRIDRF